MDRIDKKDLDCFDSGNSYKEGWKKHIEDSYRIEQEIKDEYKRRIDEGESPHQVIYELNRFLAGRRMDREKNVIKNGGGMMV